jgi:mannose-6-phosphate isomerase-like protein (cupin superfamily)
MGNGQWAIVKTFKRATMRKAVILLAAISICTGGCKQNDQPSQNESPAAAKWPDTSYWNKAVEKFDTSNYVVELKHMQAFYDVPGEFGHIAEGKDYGFNSLSFIMTSTQPNGGPPLHTHESEEAHILHEGSILYMMGEKRFSAKGPYIVRIPAGVPHTFLNTGDKELHLTAAFPTKAISYTELGRNPLVKDTGAYARKK